MITGGFLAAIAVVAFVWAGFHYLIRTPMLGQQRYELHPESLKFTGGFLIAAIIAGLILLTGVTLIALF